MRRRLFVATATITAALGVAAIAPAKVSELGTTLDQQTAACPDNCQAIGQVSGFQIQQEARKLPYRLRTYGCTYKTARLLYTVTYIPDPKPTTPVPKKKTGTNTTTTTTPTK